MATQKQIEANKRNAKKSTGPKTPEGKSIVAQNAIKHGFHSSHTLVASEDPAEFDHHCTSLLEELAPYGPMESFLANRIVTLSWHLTRATRLQSDSINTLANNEMEQQQQQDEVPLKMLNNPAVMVDLGMTCDEYYNLLGDGLEALRERAIELIEERRQKAEKEHSSVSLGSIAVRDFSETRVLDRLIMYERRIENSLYKTVLELQRLQFLRNREQSLRMDYDAEEEHYPLKDLPSGKRTPNAVGQSVILGGS